MSPPSPAYFIAVLKADLAKRKQRNSRYSLRAYARFLGLDPSTLSRILAGKQQPSIQVGRKLIRKLALDPQNSRKLAASIADQAKKRTAARFATEMGSRNLLPPAFWMDSADFEKIEDIHALAVLETTSLEGFESSPEWIARHLSITPAKAEQIITALLAAGMLKRENDRLVTVHKHMWTVDPPVDEIRPTRYQVQILEGAKAALEGVKRSRQVHTGMTMAIAPENLPLARQMIRDFVDELCDCLEMAGARKSIRWACTFTHYRKMPRTP